jgi:hypothetical protein
MRALAPEVRFFFQAQESVRQRLKPSVVDAFMARLNPCPSSSASLRTDSIGQTNGASRAAPFVKPLKVSGKK